jgi:two-component system chemotaxis sensor kinase CheA
MLTDRGILDDGVGTVPSGDLVEQFRSIALARLERVETAWATVLSSVDEHASVLIHREIHTLKGESRMLGFTDVHLVCHKLEDLLEAARARGYAVDEDFDLAVNMAFQFMAMLVRKKVSSQLRGIDLPGFIKQIESILADVKQDERTSRTGASSPLRREVAPRVPAAVRTALTPVAVDAFIEYAAARGVRRDRLRVSWHAMRDLIGNQRAVIGSGQLAKHRGGAIELARDLGKMVDAAFEIGPAEVTAEILEAIDAAVLHLVRNAVDHGIESPEERIAKGKPAAGKLRVHSAVVDSHLELSISDDGRGVSLADVHARAVALGLITQDALVSDSWFDLVCQPGFTTRLEASDVSGRGVGLDAVRAGITEVGGQLTATTVDGKGTSWRLRVPLPHLTFTGLVFRVAFAPFPVVLDDTWQLTDSADVAHTIDLAHALGISTDTAGGVTHHVTNGKITVAILADRASGAVQARRLIAVPAPGLFEVVTLETVEGLMIHPERMMKVRK